ncbi:hypothetical protein G4O51_03600 [Candidatus Bathyarchaeota archaeon A05DMB-2]|nr:hypothetical protein [Candidatus Bathyarchaeota archaeon A05DMB-2]
MEKYEGKCSKCGRIYRSHRKNDLIVCDCWRYCPICEATMQPYTPDLAPETYGKDGKRDMQILMVCNNHSPPFYSTQEPMEVVLT